MQANLKARTFQGSRSLPFRLLDPITIFGNIIFVTPGIPVPEFQYHCSHELDDGILPRGDLNQDAVSRSAVSAAAREDDVEVAGDTIASPRLDRESILEAAE
jgi:hypothetical protein